MVIFAIQYCYKHRLRFTYIGKLREKQMWNHKQYVVTKMFYCNCANPYGVLICRIHMRFNISWQIM